MYLSKICKIINAMPPHSTDGGLAGVCAYADLKNFSHITIVVQTGVGAPATVTIEKDANGSGGGTAIAFSYRLCTTAYNVADSDKLAEDVLIVGAGGFAMSGTDNTYAVIELDAAVLGTGYPFVRAAVSAVAGVHSVIYILSGARYQEPGTSFPA